MDLESCHEPERLVVTGRKLAKAKIGEVQRSIPLWIQLSGRMGS